MPLSYIAKDLQKFSLRLLIAAYGNKSATSESTVFIQTKVLRKPSPIEDGIAIAVTSLV